MLACLTNIEETPGDVFVAGCPPLGILESPEVLVHRGRSLVFPSGVLAGGASRQAKATHTTNTS